MKILFKDINNIKCIAINVFDMGCYLRFCCYVIIMYLETNM